MKFQKNDITLVVFVMLLLVAGYVTYDALFSEPQHLEGRIIEKIYVPASSTSGYTPYGRNTGSKYLVARQKMEQWVAIVVLEEGDTVQVHCKMDHYESKQVGDVMHFKKYEGEHFHIKFLAHNDEEEND